MKQRLADYVADFLVSRGITDCFSVTGGGAMHLNDALGHKEGLTCTYNHQNNQQLRGYQQCWRSFRCYGCIFSAYCTGN